MKDNHQDHNNFDEKFHDIVDKSSYSTHPNKKDLFADTYNIPYLSPYIPN